MPCWGVLISWLRCNSVEAASVTQNRRVLLITELRSTRTFCSDANERGAERCDVCSVTLLRASSGCEGRGALPLKLMAALPTSSLDFHVLALND